MTLPQVRTTLPPMLLEDPKRKFLPREPGNIAALYESTNTPHVQPHGRGAQAAQAIVVALAGPRGTEPVVALTLSLTGETVVYTGDPVPDDSLTEALEEALNFAESMGFILDHTGWSNLDDEQRLQMLDRLPMFRVPTSKRDTQPLEVRKPADGLGAVARLFAAFAFCLGAFAGGCSGMSAEQRAQGAEIHQQLGDNLLNQGDVQGALKEYLQSIDNEETPEARLGLGLVYGFAFDRPDDGEREFKRALELRKDYAEALTNLGALYLKRARYAEAIPLFQKASSDPLNKARVLAQSNLGWALYKTGQVEKGIAEIRAALKVAPKYCLGWRQLGVIGSERGRLEDARDAFGRYAGACPEVPDAHLQQGKVFARLSRGPAARAEFQKCAASRLPAEKAVAEECERLLREMGAP